MIAAITADDIISDKECGVCEPFTTPMPVTTPEEVLPTATISIPTSVALKAHQSLPPIEELSALPFSPARKDQELDAVEALTFLAATGKSSAAAPLLGPNQAVPPKQNTIAPAMNRGYNIQSRIGRATISISHYILNNQEGCLEKTGLGVPEREIRKEYGNNPDTSKALRILIHEGKIVRHGMGGRREPYSYTLAPGYVPKPLEAPADSSQNHLSDAAPREEELPSKQTPLLPLHKKGKRSAPNRLSDIVPATQTAIKKARISGLGFCTPHNNNNNSINTTTPRLFSPSSDCAASLGRQRKRSMKGAAADEMSALLTGLERTEPQLFTTDAGKGKPQRPMPSLFEDPVVGQQTKARPGCRPTAPKASASPVPLEISNAVDLTPQAAFFAHIQAAHMYWRHLAARSKEEVDEQWQPVFSGHPL